jgi:tetratricopeptide (TPR) repeat protein
MIHSNVVKPWFPGYAGTYPVSDLSVYLPQIAASVEPCLDRSNLKDSPVVVVLTSSGAAAPRRGALGRLLAPAALWLALAAQAHAIGAAEPSNEQAVDPAACVAASEANDTDKILTECGALIDNAKTTRTDRINALIARASALIRNGETDRAISDCDAVLQLDSALADIFNARGELERKKGDRVRALSDFAAALRLNPGHVSARANARALSLELERLGAQMAVAGKPSFSCAQARRPVEKAICADPELADLDREIFAANTKVVRQATSANARDGQARRREQEQYLARRDAGYGHPGFDLKKEMRDRLERLQAGGGY